MSSLSPLSVLICDKTPNTINTNNILIEEYDIYLNLFFNKVLHQICIKHLKKSILVTRCTNVNDTVHNFKQHPSYGKVIHMEFTENPDLLKLLKGVGWTNSFESYIEECWKQLSTTITSENLTKLHYTDSRISHTSIMKSDVYSTLIFFFNQIIPSLWIVDPKVSYIDYHTHINKYADVGSLDRLISSKDVIIRSKGSSKITEEDMLKRMGSKASVYFTGKNNTLLSTVYKGFVGKYTLPIKFALGHINNNDNRKLFDSILENRNTNAKLKVNVIAHLKDNQNSLIVKDDGTYNVKGMFNATTYLAKLGAMVLPASATIYISYLILGIVTSQSVEQELNEV